MEKIELTDTTPASQETLDAIAVIRLGDLRVALNRADSGLRQYLEARR